MLNVAFPLPNSENGGPPVNICIPGQETFVGEAEHRKRAYAVEQAAKPKHVVPEGDAVILLHALGRHPTGSARPAVERPRVRVRVHLAVQHRDGEAA
jgi:hypothetical protein